MEPIVLWQTQWSHGPFVPMYLFFGGLTAGVFIVAVLADLVGTISKRSNLFSKVATYSAIVMLGLAGFFLTVHLGKPERGLAFPLFFTNYNSWMTRGGWIVGAASVLMVLYAALRYFAVRSWVRRLVGVIGLPVLAFLAIYTGLLLSQARFVPLWSEKFLPVLFLNSSLNTGLAATGFIFLLTWPFLRDRQGGLQPIVFWVSLAIVVFILLELYELNSFMTFLQASNSRAPTGQFVAPKGGALAYEYVTKGALATWFWWGIIGVGLVIPLALTVVEVLMYSASRLSRTHFFDRPWVRIVPLTKFALVLIGGAILRFVIIWGGNLKAPLAFPPSTWPIPPPLAGG